MYTELADIEEMVKLAMKTISMDDGLTMIKRGRSHRRNTSVKEKRNNDREGS